MVGFTLVHFVDWLWRPRVKEYTFVEEKANFGTIYKLSFTLKGRSQPGLCALTIEWGTDKERTSVFAKWDETPNPLEGDKLEGFRPELVPSTFYQPLFLGRPYSVPVLIKAKDSYDVFSGWWFGKDCGYGPNPWVGRCDNLSLTLVGGKFSWTKSVTVDKIIELAEAKRN